VFTGEGIRAKVLEQYGESKCQTHILSVAHQQIEEGYLVSVYANQKQDDRTSLCIQTFILASSHGNLYIKHTIVQPIEQEVSAVLEKVAFPVAFSKVASQPSGQAELQTPVPPAPVEVDQPVSVAPAPAVIAAPVPDEEAYVFVEPQNLSQPDLAVVERTEPAAPKAKISWSDMARGKPSVSTATIIMEEAAPSADETVAKPNISKRSSPALDKKKAGSPGGWQDAGENKRAKRASKNEKGYKIVESASSRHSDVLPSDEEHNNIAMTMYVKLEYKSHRISIADVESVFNSYDKIRVSSTNKLFCFVHFASVEDFQKALASKPTFNGVELTVSPRKLTPNRSVGRGNGRIVGARPSALRSEGEADGNREAVKVGESVWVP